MPHNLTDHKKVERIKTCKEILKLLNNEGNYFISIIITSEEAYIYRFLMFQHVEKVKYEFLKDDSKPTMVKKKRQKKK